MSGNIITGRALQRVPPTYATWKDAIFGGSRSFLSLSMCQMILRGEKKGGYRRISAMKVIHFALVKKLLAPGAPNC